MPENNVPDGFKLTRKKSLEERATRTALVAALSVGVIALSYVAAKRGAKAVLSQGTFKVDFTLPEGYEIVNIAQI